MTDKPNARRYGWDRLDTRYPYDNPRYRVRHDEVRWPDGVTRTYTYLEFHPAVLIVPVTAAGEIVLIRQFRYTIDEWSWEIPAGGSHDFTGDDLADLARRELREEIGGEAADLRYVGDFRPLVGVVDARFHIYLATGVRLGEARPEAGELIEIHPTPLEQALAMARDGTIRVGTCAYALLRCEPLLKSMLNS